jgi:hypothetical protein
MANENISADAPSELHKLQFDYAWKWFAFHADQRVKMFNFMLVVVGIFAAGVVNALDKHLPPVAISSLCFFATFLAWTFILLDRRNRDLVWLGEDALIHLERETIFGESEEIKDGRNKDEQKIDFGILWRQVLEGRRSRDLGQIGNYWRNIYLGKHRLLLPAIAFWIGALFLAAGVLILLRKLPSH